MGGKDVELARLLQELSANALGPTVTQALGGWRLRSAAGYTRRANSVLPDGDDGSLPLDVRIAEAEAFYRRQGLPIRFQVSPAVEPPDLDAVLEARGYRAEAPTSVEVVPLAGVLERADRPPDPDVRVTVEPAPSDAWFDAWYGVSGRGADRGLARRVLESIGPAAGAERLYLQVESGNRGAMALYRRAGFRHTYTYHYRVGLPARGGETP
jgi:N-acetylglutamate synthase